jgi:hypothetical protein
METDGPAREACRYQPLYCEENAWWLCQDESLAARSCFVVFISNAARSVAMWQQRSAPEGEPLVWDYHVLVLTADPWLVWDFDTRLGWPVAAHDYFADSFVAAPGALSPRFRRVKAADYVASLVTDRAHMRRSDGSWRAEPPTWPPPGGADSAPNAMRFVDLDDVGVPGQIFDGVAVDTVGSLLSI